jgi:hypothetical protein
LLLASVFTFFTHITPRRFTTLQSPVSKGLQTGLTIVVNDSGYKAKKWLIGILKAFQSLVQISRKSSSYVSSSRRGRDAEVMLKLTQKKIWIGLELMEFEGRYK